MLVRSRDQALDKLASTSSWPMHDALDVDQVALGPLAYIDLFVGSWGKLCEICPVQTEILTACNTRFELARSLTFLYTVHTPPPGLCHPLCQYSIFGGVFVVI
jgi:hypothetical protein